MNNLKASVNMDQYVSNYRVSPLSFFPPLTASLSLTIYSSLSLVNGLIETQSLSVSELQFYAVVKNRILCERPAVLYLAEAFI